MNCNAADDLLARLNDGDADAAGQVFQDFEPLLRMVIRRKLSHGLRSKFDSTDIVQSVWADVVNGLRRSRWTFQNVAQLRAFLVRMTCNRFVDRARQHRSSLKHEVAMSPDAIEMMAATDATPVGEKLDADELWNQILDLCPPSRYEVLYLRRQGASLDDIATQTGLHKGSVRRILYEIGRLLARRCAADDPR